MVQAGEIEHGAAIADRADVVWNWASPAGQVRAWRRAERIGCAAEFRAGLTVLELGCGTGVFTRYFAESRCELVAIDISPDLLERARSRLGLSEVRLRVEDAEQLSFADATFDRVVGSSVLHHLDLQRALAEIYRVLKPGGRMAFAEPNMLNPQIALQRTIPALRRWAQETPEETAYFRWGLARRLEEAGFVNVHVEPFDFLHPAVPRPMVRLAAKIGRTLERLPILREIAGSLLLQAHKP
jgi:ubiquinone/menaquinone biosynthesis C-methylase UbiE